MNETPQLHFPVSSKPGDRLWGAADVDALGLVNQYGQSRKHIFDSVQHSLRRLQLDYIDVLQCSSHPLMQPMFSSSGFFCPGHRFDYETPVEEVVRASPHGRRATYGY
jgi:aryl-alcohol dehydrogenase-like predicted oxidoreductase